MESETQRLLAIIAGIHALEEKLKEVGLRPIAGRGSVTVSVTGIVCGLLFAPAALTVIVPE